MINAKTGVSHGTDSYSVAVEAASKAFKPNEPIVAAIVLSSVSYDSKTVLQAVQSVVGVETVIVGASTAGEITEHGPTKTKSIAVMILYGADVKAYAAVGSGIDADPKKAGADMASALKDQVPEGELKFLILFDDVLTGNGADIVRGVQSVLGDNFPLAGGAAGDDFEFKQTFQFLNADVHTSSVVGLALTGDISFGIGVRHGWIPVGVPMKVTKSAGSVVHEIDNKPAISVYRDYFGDAVADEISTQTLAKAAITYPLGMKTGDAGEYLIRDPLSVDDQGAITCAAEIPEGSEVSLMLGSKEEAIAHAILAAEQSVETLGKAPQAAIIFNCIARNKLFAQDNHEEITAIQTILGEIPLVGFYTYGEQAPILGESRHIEQCQASFHNETVVILTLG